MIVAIVASFAVGVLIGAGVVWVITNADIDELATQRHADMMEAIDPENLAQMRKDLEEYEEMKRRMV